MRAYNLGGTPSIGCGYAGTQATPPDFDSHYSNYVH